MAKCPVPNKRRALGMRGALWLMVALTMTCTVLGVSALYAYQLHRAGSAVDRLRVRTIAETYATQVAVILSGPPQNISSGISNIAWHPDLCLLAVLNDAKEITVCRGNCEMLNEYMRNSDWRQGDITLKFGEQAPEPIPNVHLSAVGINAPASGALLGTLICAIKSSNRTLWNMQEIYYVFIKVFLLMGAGSIFGFFWLHKTILTPLMQLVNVTKDAEANAAVINLSGSQYDEIGKIAQLLCDLQKDRDRWQHRAAQLERSLHDRVAHETKKVERELEQTKRETWMDPLTQLGNRRMMELKFGEIFEAQRQTGEDLSLIMIDIDNFKNLNDTLGHKAGDKLLQFVGDLLRQFLRERDIAIRYGGDEFTIVLAGVPLNNALSIAERTIALFAQQAKLLPVEPKPTMSAGIATLNEHKPKSPESFLHLADTALYHAKKAGKCCAKVYTSNLIVSNGAPKHSMVQT